MFHYFHRPFGGKTTYFWLQHPHNWVALAHCVGKSPIFGFNTQIQKMEKNGSQPTKTFAETTCQVARYAWRHPWRRARYVCYPTRSRCAHRWPPTGKQQVTATPGVGNEQLKKAAKGYPGCLGYIKEIILITQLCGDYFIDYFNKDPFFWPTSTTESRSFFFFVAQMWYFTTASPT